MKTMNPWLRFNFLLTDFGFLIYWSIVALGLMPHDLAFKDYHDPVIQAWNWSFFPIDILASVLGLSAVYLHKLQNTLWSTLALMSVMLTFCAGLFAIAFWTIRADFEIQWWIPNLYLFLWPVGASWLFMKKYSETR